MAVEQQLQLMLCGVIIFAERYINRITGRE